MFHESTIQLISSFWIFFLFYTEDWLTIFQSDGRLPLEEQTGIHPLHSRLQHCICRKSRHLHRQESNHQSNLSIIHLSLYHLHCPSGTKTLNDFDKFVGAQHLKLCFEAHYRDIFIRSFNLYFWHLIADGITEKYKTMRKIKVTIFSRSRLRISGGHLVSKEVQNTQNYVYIWHTM